MAAVESLQFYDRIHPFVELNDAENLYKSSKGKRGRKVPKDERSALIRQVFPSVETLDWGKAFEEDVNLLGRILRDILKVDAAEPGKSGPRAAMEYDPGVKRLRQMMGEDYSLLPFPEAFAVLVGHRTQRAVADRTGLSKTAVVRLLAGERQPTSGQMKQIADGFKKHPSYFVEWRTGFILGVLSQRLSGAPESTVSFYRKVTKADDKLPVGV